jgi:L-aminopeptidase/D-esterase-like protein
MCVSAHDALARMVVPAHTMLDGDVAFASTIEDGPRNTELSMHVSMATELAVEEAILRAATAAT